MYKKLKHISDFPKLNTTFNENSCKFKQSNQKIDTLQGLNK